MKNPTIEDRTVEEALKQAEQTRTELPHIVQVWPCDWDTCVLANEIYRLRKELENYKLDNLLRQELSNVQNAINNSQRELDPEAKRILYSNMRKLYLR